MKTMKKSNFKKISILLLLVIFSAGYIKGQNINKTYNWKYNLSGDARVSMANYDCNLAIHTWDKGEAELRLTIEAEPKSAEDGEVLDKYLKDLTFSSAPSSASFSSRFWESRNTSWNRTTMKLRDGKNVSLKSFTIKGELWIPVNCMFTLDSKYSRISLEDFSGPLILNLYNDNLTGGTVLSAVEITDKYSTIEFRDLKDCRVNLYNSKLTAGNTGNFSIESKYSGVSLASSGDLKISSYNDKYEIPKTGDVTFAAKYSDLKTETSGEVGVDLYNSNLSMNEAKDVNIRSKYSEISFSKAGRCSVQESYNDKLTFGKLTSLTVSTSKYTTFSVDYLSEYVKESDGYNDNFSISGTGKEFSGFSLNGKYLDADAVILKGTSYKFRADVKYPDLHIDESALKDVVRTIDGSSMKYDAVKGTESEGMPVIEITGYQIALRITEK